MAIIKATKPPLDYSGEVQVRGEVVILQSSLRDDRLILEIFREGDEPNEYSYVYLSPKKATLLGNTLIDWVCGLGLPGGVV